MLLTEPRYDRLRRLCRQMAKCDSECFKNTDDDALYRKKAVIYYLHYKDTGVKLPSVEEASVPMQAQEEEEEVSDAYLDSEEEDLILSAVIVAPPASSSTPVVTPAPTPGGQRKISSGPSPVAPVTDDIAVGSKSETEESGEEESITQILAENEDVPISEVAKRRLHTRSSPNKKSPAPKKRPKKPSDPPSTPDPPAKKKKLKKNNDHDHIGPPANTPEQPPGVIPPHMLEEAGVTSPPTRRSRRR